MCPATLQWELRQYLNQEVNISQEEQSQAKRAVETIKKEFQSFQHQSPYNFRQMFHQGSSYEGLKVIAADEFDLLVPFYLNDDGWSITSPRERGLSGYHRIERQSAEATWSSLTEYGSLSPAKVRQNMQSIVQQAVNGMSVGMRINPSYSGPAITLNVEYNNGSRMSIDVVPCLVLYGRKFVAKSPRNAGNYMYSKCDQLWRESFSEQEKEIFKNIDRGNECRRDCLKILKTIQKKRGQSQLGMLSSYHLKTCMLHLINEQPGLSWHHDALADRFKNLLQKLMYYIERQNMPNYFQRSVNLLDQYADDNGVSLNKVLGWLRRATIDDQHIIDILLHKKDARETQQQFDDLHPAIPLECDVPAGQLRPDVRRPELQQQQRPNNAGIGFWGGLAAVAAGALAVGYLATRGEKQDERSSRGDRGRSGE